MAFFECKDCGNKIPETESKCMKCGTSYSKEEIIERKKQYMYGQAGKYIGASALAIGGAIVVAGTGGLAAVAGIGGAALFGGYFGKIVGEGISCNKENNKK